MKIKREVYDQFRDMCRGERNTSNKEIEYKIHRNFELGELRKILREEHFIKTFGSFAMEYDNGTIINIDRDYINTSQVNLYAKYKYDFIHKGVEFANKKYSQDVNIFEN